MIKNTVRKPTLKDAPGIQCLVRHYSARKFLLPRTLDQVCENLRDFFICEKDGEIAGCGALHFWSELAEIRSLAVAEAYWRHGIGSDIVRACLDEARALAAAEVFVLTYQPEFFERFGFRRVGKDRFPRKIWMDCANCPHFPNCTETALILDLSEPAGNMPTKPQALP